MEYLKCSTYPVFKYWFSKVNYSEVQWQDYDSVHI